MALSPTHCSFQLLTCDFCGSAHADFDSAVTHGCQSASPPMKLFKKGDIVFVPRLPNDPSPDRYLEVEVHGSFSPVIAKTMSLPLKFEFSRLSEAVIGGSVIGVISPLIPHDWMLKVSPTHSIGFLLQASKTFWSQSVVKTALEVQQEKDAAAATASNAPTLPPPAPAQASP